MEPTEFNKMKNLFYNLILIILCLNCNFFNSSEKDNAKVLILHNHSAPKSMLFTNDESLMLTFGHDASISFWNTIEKKQVLSIKPFPFDKNLPVIAYAELVGGEKYIAVFFKGENKFFLVDIAKKKVIKERNVDFEFISYSRNKDLIAIGREQKKYIELRNVFNWSLKCFLNLKGTTYRFASSEEGNYLAVALDDNSVSLYDVNKCKEIYSIPFSDIIYNIFIFEKEASLIVNHRPNDMNIIDLNTGKNLKKWKPHLTEDMYLRFSSDGQFIATGGGDDHEVKIWNRKNFTFVKSFHFTQIYRIYYTKDSKSIFMMGTYNGIVIWDLTKEKFYSESYPNQNGENK